MAHELNTTAVDDKDDISGTDLLFGAAGSSDPTPQPYTMSAIASWVFGSYSGPEITAAGRALIDDADAAAQRTTLGLVIGTNVQAYDADLTAIAALTTASYGRSLLTLSSASALASEIDSYFLTPTEGNAAYQPLDADLTAIAALTSAADKLPYFTGSGTAALATFTAAGRALIDDADAAAQRTTLGLVIGTNVQAYDADLTAIAALTTASYGRSLLTLSSASALASEIDSYFLTPTEGNAAYQPLDADLTAIAALTSAADKLPYFTGSGTAALATFTAAGRALVDDADAAAQLTTLFGGGVLSPSQLTSDQNNYAPTGHASCAVLRLSSDASRNVTGLAGGAGGRIVIVHNVGAQSIVLKDESASSTAANRFALTGDLTLAADAVALLQYDGTSSRWRAVSGGGGGGVTSVTAGVGLSGGTITSTGTINVQVPLFQCQFNKSGSDLALTRWNGKYLFINGVNEVIPSGGVTLAPTGLTANTTYYVYAYINAGTMTLEASTTAPTVDTTYGHKVKTGDAARSLVGMARAIAGPAWADSALQRFVLSYYNRRNIVGTVTSIDTSSTTSESFVAINSTNKLEFLTWGDEAVIQNASGILNNSTTAGMSFTVGLDGTANTSARTQLNGGNASMQTPMSTTAVNSVAEGYHYAQTWAASVTAGNTTTIFTNWSNILVRG